MDWNRRHTVSYPLLGVQFLVCVGCWVTVVLLLGGTISRNGLIASVVTGCVLVAVTWLLALFGVPPTPVRSSEVAAPREAAAPMESAPMDTAPAAPPEPG